MGIHVGHPKRSLCTKFKRNPVGVVRVTAPSLFTSKQRRSQVSLVGGADRIPGGGWQNSRGGWQNSGGGGGINLNTYTYKMSRRAA